MPEMGGVADEASLLVWDSELSPPPYTGRTVLWSSVAEEGAQDVVSVPLLVERDADVVRSRYLAWVHDVGQDTVDGHSLIDRLQLRPGFSYWWMTPLSEKCNYAKSQQIDHAIRLLAFSSWVDRRVVRRLVLATSDECLANCFRIWCAGAGAVFEWQKLPTQKRVSPWYRRIGGALPDSVQAVVWLAKYVLGRWPLKGQGLREWRETEAKVTFASYSLNLRPDTTRSGHFESLYWGALPKAMSCSGRQSNWMHLYVEDANLPSPVGAKKAFGLFNKNEKRVRMHVTPDAFLGWDVIARSLRDWLRFRHCGDTIPRAFRSSRCTGIDIGSLFEREWQQSFWGRDALRNFLYYNLVEAAVRALPKQDIGVYLQENQPWEMAFVHAWRSAGHGRLIGVPHSSVRYWDLRYFFDGRDSAGDAAHMRPLPDQVAVNGPVAMRVLQAGNHLSERLVLVEALRYQYLVDMPKAMGSEITRHSGCPLRILVLTDYDAGHTEKQLLLLAKTLHLLSGDAQIVVKSHPALPLSSADFPGQQMKTADRPLPELLAMSDVAYTSSVTSAAVDAYCAGLPVVALFDPTSLNMSPLRGLNAVEFVHTPEQLAHALMGVPREKDRKSSAENFFTLDKMLPRWRQLLALAEDSPAVGRTGN
jgi:surface carbohydrate biosynthesis protein (TIGR04326 family)